MLLVLQDIHLIEKPPGYRKSSYLREVATKLVECSQIANQFCETVVFLGDLFHGKKPESTSHNTVRVLLACLKLFKVKKYLIFGNHDLRGVQQKIRIHQPVGVVLESGQIEYLGGKKFELEGVEFVGIDYDQKFEEGEKSYHYGGKDQQRVLLMHASMNKESGLRKMIGGHFDLCFFGHIHWPEGQQGKWINYGSFARTSIDDYNQRMVSVAVLNKDLTVSEVVLNRQKHFTEIYEDRVPPELEESDGLEDKDVDAFIESMKMEGETNHIDFINSLEPDVRERVNYYLGGF